MITRRLLIDDSRAPIRQRRSNLRAPQLSRNEYHGEVTARYALALSLNNATVRLAQEVGFDKVADLARAAGISA